MVESPGRAAQSSWTLDENSWRWPSEQSVSRGSPPTAKAEVEAGFHDALGFVDAEDEGRSTDETEVSTAEVVKIVFDEASEVVGKGILSADANRPAAAGIANRSDDHPISERKFIALPSAAAFT